MNDTHKSQQIDSPLYELRRESYTRKRAEQIYSPLIAHYTKKNKLTTRMKDPLTLLIIIIFFLCNNPLTLLTTIKSA